MRIPFTNISLKSTDIILCILNLLEAVGLVSMIVGIIYLLIFNEIASYIYYPLLGKPTNSADATNNDNTNNNNTNTNTTNTNAINTNTTNTNATDNTNTTNTTDNTNITNNTNTIPNNNDKYVIGKIYGPDPLLQYSIVLNLVYASSFIIMGILYIMCEYKQKAFLDNVQKCFINRKLYITK